MTIVSNAGPLIAFAQLGRLEILHQLYGRLHIPSAVFQEVALSHPLGAGAGEVQTVSWIYVVHVEGRTAVALLRDRLDEGESEAIVLALEMNAGLLLIDEARGRRVAEARGIKITGTIGTLVMAKKRGLIKVVTPLLDTLLSLDFRMSEQLYQTARQLANEG